MQALAGFVAVTSRAPKISAPIARRVITSFAIVTGRVRMSPLGERRRSPADPGVREPQQLRPIRQDAARVQALTYCPGGVSVTPMDTV
jgi:hypothetical protein